MKCRLHAPRPQRGLSLIELLLGLTITVLVLAPLLPMLETTHAAARITAERQDLERSAGFALARISARVRATKASSDLAALPKKDWFKPVVYLLLECGPAAPCQPVDSCNPAATACQLVEREGTSDRILAQSVTAFSIEAPAVVAGQPLVEIGLALARGQSSTATSASVRMGSIQ